MNCESTAERMLMNMASIRDAALTIDRRRPNVFLLRPNRLVDQLPETFTESHIMFFLLKVVPDTWYAIPLITSNELGVGDALESCVGILSVEIWKAVYTFRFGS